MNMSTASLSTIARKLKRGAVVMIDDSDPHIVLFLAARFSEAWTYAWSSTLFYIAFHDYN